MKIGSSPAVLGVIFRVNSNFGEWLDRVARIGKVVEIGDRLTRGPCSHTETTRGSISQQTGCFVRPATCQRVHLDPHHFR